MITRPNLNFICIALTVIAVGYALLHTERINWESSKKDLLLDICAKENELLAAQLGDYQQHVAQIRYEEYRRGYDSGAAETGIALAQGTALQGYEEGYHAALTQFDPDFSTSADPVVATFLSMYTEALEAGNKDDAVFYMDMVVAQMHEELKLSATESSDKDLLAPWASASEYEHQTTLELLEQLQDDLSESDRPSVGDNFTPLNKQE